MQTYRILYFVGNPASGQCWKVGSIMTADELIPPGPDQEARIARLLETGAVAVVHA